MNVKCLLARALATEGQMARLIGESPKEATNIKLNSSLITHHSSLSRGFTLLEIIIATSIVAILGIVISQVLSTITRTNTKVGIISDVKQNGDYALLSMDRLIRSARRVTTSCSETGTSSPSVTVEDLGGNTTTLMCVLDGSVTRIASVSGLSTVYLSGTNVTLGGTDCAGSTLTFTCTGAQGGFSGISIGFSLSQKSTSPFLFEQSTVPFQSTVIVRNR